MRYYETIYIVDPNLENTILEKTMAEIGQELEKTKAKIINHRDWGKKRLAYQVDNQKYGSFILLQYQIKELSKMNDFDTWLKLNSLVLRHMTVSLDKKPDKYTSTNKCSLLVSNKIIANTKTGKYLNKLLYISESIVLFNALIVSIFNIVRAKKNNANIDFWINEKESELLKTSIIIDSLTRTVKRLKTIRLKRKIILSILKYIILIDSILFLAFKSPE